MIVEIMDRIFPNNSRGVIIIIIIIIIIFSHKNEAIIRGRQYCSLKVVPYFLFYYSIKSKNDHIK